MTGDALFLPGLGYDSLTTFPAPSAGDDFPAQAIGASGFRSQFLSMSFSLATSAVAGNRRVAIIAQWGVTPTDCYAAIAQVVQPASTTVRYFLSPGYADSTAILDNRILMRWPFPLELFSTGNSNAWLIRSEISGIDAGDQLGAATVWVRGARGG